MKGPQELYINPGCLKYISGISLSPANKNLFIIPFTLYFYRIAFNMGKSLRIGNFIPVKLPNNPLVSCSLRISTFYYYALNILIKELFFRF